MSLDRSALSFLARSRASGVSLAQPATIGRQGMVVSAADIRHALVVAGADPTGASSCAGQWLDPFLECLGAQRIVSVDASDYEGASVVHDLNLPIPADMEGKFSAVIDVGSLEHIFDFPVAIRNLMRMVEVGGHLILVMPTNNEPGHGFYQFSPELLFRVLSPRYGFEVEEMLIRELGRPFGRWHRVADPEVVGQRAQFRSRAVTYLFIRARRTGSIPDFHPPPQQSDYSAAWKARKFGEVARPGSVDVLASLGQRVSSRATEVPWLSRPLGWSLAWARQIRMFHRVRYTRLPSHFSRVRGFRGDRRRGTSQRP